MVTEVLEPNVGHENDLFPVSMSDDVMAWILESMSIGDLLERVRRLDLTLVPGEPIRVALEMEVYDINTPLVDWSKGLEKCPVVVRVEEKEQREGHAPGWETEGSDMWDGAGTS